MHVSSIYQRLHFIFHIPNYSPLYPPLVNANLKYYTSKFEIKLFIAAIPASLLIGIKSCMLFSTFLRLVEIKKKLQFELFKLIFQLIFVCLFLQASSSSSSKYPGSHNDVTIEAPSMNSRRITASILINGDINDVWSILTDYNNLATHVPNLVRSYLVPSPTNSIRLFQEGSLLHYIITVVSIHANLIIFVKKIF